MQSARFFVSESLKNWAYYNGRKFHSSEQREQNGNTK